MNIHGKEYTEVKDRIVALLVKYPDAAISTRVEWHKEDFSAVCIRATIYPLMDKPEYYFSGLAYEERATKSGEVNADAWVENCETSAIGRALANMNIGVNGTRPSAEEMKKVQKGKERVAVEALQPPPKKEWRVEVDEVIGHIGTYTDADQLIQYMSEVKTLSPMTFEPEELEHILAYGRETYAKLTKKGKK